MDYENEVKNQKTSLASEEKRILLMHKNPKLARKLFDKDEELKNIELKKNAKRQAINRINAVEKKYKDMGGKNIKYKHRRMLSELDMRQDYKLIKIKLEAKMRREEMREIIKTREVVKQKLIKERKEMRVKH